MADIQIPREAIEAAAVALRDLTGGAWENLDQVRSVLDAATPHLDLVTRAEPDEVDDEDVAYWGPWRGPGASFVCSGPDGFVDMSYAPFSRRATPNEARAIAAQLLAAAKHAEKFCGGCEKAPCVCVPDQGGEYPCMNCGTTGWDCLTGMNSSPAERRCCRRCPYVDGHKRSQLRAQS